MKYKHTTISKPKDWKEGCGQDLITNLKRKLFDKVLPTVEYIIGNHNRLKNTSLIKYDQILHKD